MTVDVLAVKGKPSGVTARFVLEFAHRRRRSSAPTGSRAACCLTAEGDGWQVFGYDVTKRVA